MECVALDTARITTQSQSEILFKTQVEVKEVSDESVPIMQTKITNNDGVVKLQSVKEANDDENMSSDSDVEIVSHQSIIKPQAEQKKVQEEIGKIVLFLTALQC